MCVCTDCKPNKIVIFTLTGVKRGVANRPFAFILIYILSIVILYLARCVRTILFFLDSQTILTGSKHGKSFFFGGGAILPPPQDLIGLILYLFLEEEEEDLSKGAEHSPSSCSLSPSPRPSPTRDHAPSPSLDHAPPVEPILEPAPSPLPPNSPLRVKLLLRKRSPMLDEVILGWGQEKVTRL